jgi:hypothetical protein
MSWQLPAARKATGPEDSGVKLRLASPRDLTAVIELTNAAYAPWTPLLGAPPVPVTEDYVPRIERGEVWLLEEGTKIAGLVTL